MQPILTLVHGLAKCPIPTECLHGALSPAKDHTLPDAFFQILPNILIWPLNLVSESFLLIFNVVSIFEIALILYKYSKKLLQIKKISLYFLTRLVLDFGTSLKKSLLLLWSQVCMQYSQLFSIWWCHKLVLPSLSWSLITRPVHSLKFHRINNNSLNVFFSRDYKFKRNKNI